MKTDVELKADLMERLDAIPSINGSDLARIFHRNR